MKICTKNPLIGYLKIKNRAKGCLFMTRNTSMSPIK